MNHVSVSPTDGNGPTQGQRKTLTRVGIEPTTFGLDHRCSTDYPSNGKCCKRDYCECNFSFSCGLKLLVIVCKACLFTTVSSEVFDHCKVHMLWLNFLNWFIFFTTLFTLTYLDIFL